MFPFKLKRVPTDTSAAVVATERLRARYIRFCTGPFFTTDELSEHFDEVLEEPMQQIGFTTESTSRLVVASLPISFRDPFGPPTARIELGPMLAFFSRDIEAPSRCTVTFERIIPTGETSNGNAKVMHPHINSEGILCIGRGKNELEEAIRHGDLLLAIRMTLTILNTYDPNRAYGEYREPEAPYYSQMDE